MEYKEKAQKIDVNLLLTLVDCIFMSPPLKVYLAV